MKRVRWLLVGAGDIAARRVGPALVSARDSEVTAVCDLKRERVEALAARLGVGEVYTDYETALAESVADAVYIATPQSLHVDMSLKALAAGKHFLCEKPLGLNGAECLTLLKAVRHSNRITSCSNYRRLSEQYKSTEAMLARGEIGSPTGGWAVYSTPFYNPGHQPVRRAMGMSRIKELGFYLIDIVHNLLGMPVSVMAQSSIIQKAAMNDVEDVASVVLNLPRGIFTMVFNCTSPGTRHEMEFFGTGGRIHWPEWPPHGNGAVFKHTPSGVEKIEARTAENCHLPMVEDYVQAVIEGRTPVCTVESAVRTEVITDAIFRSIESGRCEPVIWGDWP